MPNLKRNFSGRERDCAASGAHSISSQHSPSGRPRGRPTARRYTSVLPNHPRRDVLLGQFDHVIPRAQVAAGEPQFRGFGTGGNARSVSGRPRRSSSRPEVTRVGAGCPAEARITSVSGSTLALGARQDRRGAGDATRGLTAADQLTERGADVVLLDDRAAAGLAREVSIASRSLTRRCIIWPPIVRRRASRALVDRPDRTPRSPGSRPDTARAHVDLLRESLAHEDHGASSGSITRSSPSARRGSRRARSRRRARVARGCA